MVARTKAAMQFHKSILLQSATGSGKTAMSVHMIRSAYQKGSRTWFMVPRRELITQTARTMERLELPYSYIAAGYALNPYARIQIVSVGTVVNRLDKIRPDQVPNLLIVDETHFGAGALDTIIQWAKANGTFLVGLSATPWRSSGEGLGKWYDTMIEGPSVAWLIENGFLSKFRAYAPSSPDLSKIKTTAGDYAKGELASFMEQDRVLIGDAVRHYREHAMGRLNVAYCTSRKHSEMTAAKFRDEGIPAQHIDGETPDDERRRLIRAFAKREIKVLTSVDLLTFGFDLAAQAGFDVTVEAMSDLRPTKSLALQMQKWGRVLRKKEYPAIILDHSNNISFFKGLPDADRVWSLQDRETQGKGGQGLGTIPNRQCKQCFYCHPPAPACPECGNVYPVEGREVEHLDGDLAEITSGPPARTEKEMKGQLQAMIQIAKQRGYRDPEAWAAKKLTERIAKNRGESRA